MKNKLALVLVLSLLSAQTAFAQSSSSNVVYRANANSEQNSSCADGAIKGATVALVGGGVLVILDCIFTGCIFTAATLATTGTIEAAAVAATASGSTYGCVAALVD